jgi:hypothetical protein
VAEIANLAISWGVFAKTGAGAKTTMAATVTLPAKMLAKESNRE